jgi:GH15 family glucan-1,4-alpha-glucosidase
MGYLPIEDHGVIGELHTAALVGTDGTVDWLCLSAFDSPSVFCSILDDEKGGHFKRKPERYGRSQQLYLPDTNVLLTRFLSPEGGAEILDFMPVHNGDGARLALKKMFSYANHLGLYAEEVGPSGEALGNFPQALTHLGLISAAVNLDQALGSR